MGREVSAFLDLVRLLAAIAVFLSHASWQDHTGGVLWQLGTIGREAVDVFFVLSGFVIGHAAQGRTLRDYMLSRLARVYSVALPALVLTFVLDGIGRSVRPALYHGFCCDHGGAPVWQMLRNAVFAGNIWGAEVSPGSDIPYWSLGFEAWYYLAFGLLVFLPRRWGWVGAVGAMVVAGPGIAVLFPLWLLGVWCRGWRLPGMAGWLALGGGVAGVVLSALFQQRIGQIYDPFSLSPGRLMDYAQDYGAGGCFALALVGIQSVGPRVRWLAGRMGYVRWAAGATFALYLFHVPIIRVIAATSPWAVGDWRTRGMVMIGVPLVVLLLAEVTERRKQMWRRGLQWIAGGA